MNSERTVRLILSVMILAFFSFPGCGEDNKSPERDTSTAMDASMGQDGGNDASTKDGEDAKDGQKDADPKDPSECTKACIEKGGNANECADFCGESKQDPCVEQCLAKGTSEAECEMYCFPQNPDECEKPCLEKGGTAEECKEFCAGTKSSSLPSDSFPQLTRDTAGTFAIQVDHDGGTREAIVHVPSGFANDGAAPVLLNFHGFGGTAESHMNQADLRDLSEQHGFLLVYPQGSLLEGEPHWNSSAPSSDNKSEADDFGFVGALLDAIHADFSFDRRRVYAAGYSNGGMMAFGLACYTSETISAVVSISGAMLDDIGVSCTPSSPTSVLTIHGTNDFVLSYDGGEGFGSAEETVAFWVEHNEITSEPELSTLTSGSIEVETIHYLGGNSGTEVHHYKVVGGDHVWFELDLEEATTHETIWAFVSRFSLDGALD